MMRTPQTSRSVGLQMARLPFILYRGLRLIRGEEMEGEERAGLGAS